MCKMVNLLKQPTFFHSEPLALLALFLCLSSSACCLRLRFGCGSYVCFHVLGLLFCMHLSTYSVVASLQSPTLLLKMVTNPDDVTMDYHQPLQPQLRHCSRKGW